MKATILKPHTYRVAEMQWSQPKYLPLHTYRVAEMQWNQPKYLPLYTYSVAVMQWSQPKYLPLYTYSVDETQWSQPDSCRTISRVLQGYLKYANDSIATTAKQSHEDQRHFACCDHNNAPDIRAAAVALADIFGQEIVCLPPPFIWPNISALQALLVRSISVVSMQCSQQLSGELCP